MDPEVVSFVMRQLQGGLLGKCLRSVLKVKNFMKEVNNIMKKYKVRLTRKGDDVSSTFMFDLELQHSNAGSCQRESGSAEQCSVRVMRLRDGRTARLLVLWGSTTCSRDAGGSSQQ